MIRVGMRLPGPFRVSGGPIAAFFALFLYVCVVMVWVTVIAAVFLAAGIAYVATAGRIAWRRRHAKPRDFESPMRGGSEARRIRSEYGPYLDMVKAARDRRRGP
ncbi:hypothetical protein ABT173_48615 [Streptomyces sp. NPDC001795]|uniref:hypothetical protein n=1 Tax=unclassified Streptomyces TaxID=2593676 RepID=UPI00331CFABF